MAYPFPIGSLEIVADHLTSTTDLDKSAVLLELFSLVDWITETHGDAVVGSVGPVLQGEHLVEALWDYAHKVKSSVPTPYGETLVLPCVSQIVRSLLSEGIEIVNSGASA